MGLIYSKFYDIPVDPYASTVDSITEYYHVQSTSKGGTYLDIKADAALNFPVNTPSRLFVYLPQRVDRSDLTGSRGITITDTTAAVNLTRVTGLPTGNEYRIPPESSVRRDTIEISSTKLNRTISYDYYGIGSVLNANEYNNRHWVNNYSIAANYAIEDDDYYNCIDVAHSSTTAKITVTLPTVAQNTGRLVRVQNTGSGLTLIEGEGSEKISFLDNLLDDVKLLMNDDFVELRSNGTKWICEHANINMITNWINRADWTAVKIGSAFTYDNKSAAVDLTGQHITEATSDQKAIILYDSGGTGTTGIIYAYNITDSTTGLGYWTNNRIVTCGSGGYTITVDEGSGSSKNIDYNIYCGQNINISCNKMRLFYCATATFTGAQEMPLSCDYYGNGGNVIGLQLYQVDVNNYFIITGNVGLANLTSIGGFAIIGSDDTYYNLKLGIQF